jgi:hypothetical protein
VKSFRNCGALILLLWTVVGCMWAQEATAPRHIGVTQDWSNHHIVFSRDGLLAHPGVLSREPRVLHGAMQRWQAPAQPALQAVANTTASPTGSQSTRDWNVSLGTNHLAVDTFPAKYSFDPTLPPDCANDFVVFGLTTPGVDGGQANLVAFNNLYAGPGGICGAAPTVLFAYNITTVAGGRITTSPILSDDGSKIAFVESVPGAAAIFHVLTWTRGQGTIKAAASAPSTIMSSLTYSPSFSDTASSPWLDDFPDVVYVGADSGSMYKISGVFRSTPTLTNVWPVTSSKYKLYSPVLDSTQGLLMVGSGNASIYQIDTTSGTATPHAIGTLGDKDSTVVASPIIDVTNGTTFTLSADAGATAVLVELDTFSLQELARANIGAGALNTTTALFLYEPALDNNYYNDPSTGVIRTCGTGAADTSPWEYAFGFTGRTMKTNPSYSRQLSTSTVARCTGWTEFYNPNIGGGTDFFFFGLTQDCTGTGTGASTGCVISRGKNNVLTKATVTGGPSAITADNYSTSSQAHSIYFSAMKANLAYKFTQDTLQ